MCARRNNKQQGEQTEKGGAEDREKVKMARPVNSLASIKPMKLFRQVIGNPDLSYQIMVILLTLTSDNVKMDRRINTMTSSIDSLRSISEVLTTSVRSLQTAAEAPKQIRKLLKPGDS